MGSRGGRAHHRLAKNDLRWTSLASGCVILAEIVLAIPLSRCDYEIHSSRQLFESSALPSPHP